MFSPHFFRILVCATTIILLDNAQSNPIEQRSNPIAEQKNAELTDLSRTTAKNVTTGSTFIHRDEDQPRTEANLDLDMSGDVEILEMRDSNVDDNVEIEERFRGPALQLNTDTFASENIEVNEDGKHGAKTQSRLLMNIMVVVIALISIGIYVGLVMWRMYLEERYGTRELLTNILDDDYLQDYHQENCNNNSSGNGSSTVAVPITSDSNRIAKTTQ